MFADIHNHLLPNIDDGKTTMSLLKDILSNYENCYIDTIVFTPHLFNPYVHTSIGKIKETFESCSKLAEAYGIKTYLGSEIYVKDTEDLIQGVPIDGRYYLIEASTQFPPKHFIDKIQKALDEGFGIILAHIERYIWLSPESEIFLQLQKMGVIFQVNANAINTPKAKEYLSQNLVDVFATDNHGKLDEPKLLALAYATYPEVAIKAKFLYL